MKGWLDKYNDGGPVQENYNDYSVSASSDFVGEGYSNRGRNYSPAWGGQFAMGGSMPGAVGFTYARTNDPAPSEGPYAKKTLPSAQNGTEMRYYQEGLDWKPKTISKDGSKNSKLTNQETIKKLGLKPAKTVNPVEQANLYVPEIHQNDFIHMTVKDAYNTYLKEPVKQAFEVAANPISALSAMNRHGRLPRNFSKGEYSPFDIATSWENPFARLSSMIDTYQSGKDILSGQGNFADYVDIGLGTLTGAGVAKKAAKGAINKVDKIKKAIEFNKEQSKLPNREATDWMKNMYSHPDIKQRIIDNTPDELVKGYTWKSQDPVTREIIIETVPDSYKKGKRIMWNDPVTKPIVDKNYNDLLKEKGLKEWMKFYRNSLGVSYGTPDEIYSKVRPFNNADRQSTRVHEATHAMEWNGLGFSKQEDDKLLKPFNLTGKQQYDLPADKGYGMKYYTDPTEIHARMNQSRYLLGHKPGQQYTMDDYNKSMKMNNLNGMGKYIQDPNAFIDLMNTFYQAAPVVGAGALGAAAIANQPEMEQGGQLTKLDQLTNFTNYNTKQPGGWLDKYEG